MHVGFICYSIIKKTKVTKDLEKLDAALREVRGVSLNQKLEEGMMGGALPPNASHAAITNKGVKAALQTG